MTSQPSSPAASNPRPSRTDPILRNALRYTISAREYEVFHRYLISRSPPLKRKAPAPRDYSNAVHAGDDFNASALRVALRVFLATQTGLKIWDILTSQIMNRKSTRPPKSNVSFWRSPNIRLSLSLSLILLFHRLLHRFFVRLRANLLTSDARPFRRRNPRISKALVSKFAPAVGASLAGFFLGVYPGDQLRFSISIYVATRAAEFMYNALEDEGWFKGKPWWFGSWLLFSLSCGQLMHAFVFDRDCFPTAYEKFILKHSRGYIPQRPEDYPPQLAWPDQIDVVDSLAQISYLKWPAFVSPILFPKLKTLPPSLSTVAPILEPAHPAIKSLSCALLHPEDPSCLRTYITYYIKAIPQLSKPITALLLAMSIPRYRAFLKDPVTSVNQLAKSILRLTIFVSGCLGTAWGSICFFQNVLPRSFLPTSRWYLAGYFGGLWAFLERRSGRSNFLYAMRLSIDSLWKVGVKRGWWTGVKGGDVWVFVVGLIVMNSVYEVDPKAVSGSYVRKGVGMLRGEGWVDRAQEAKGGSDVRAQRDVKATGVELPEGPRYYRPLTLSTWSTTSSSDWCRSSASALALLPSDVNMISSVTSLSRAETT